LLAPFAILHFYTAIEKNPVDFQREYSVCKDKTTATSWDWERLALIIGDEPIAKNTRLEMIRKVN